MSLLFDVSPQSLAPLSEQEILSWLRLYRTENVGPITFRRLLARYHTPAAALEHLPDMARKTGRELTLPSAEAIREEYEGLLAIGGRWVTWHCAEYPTLLGQIPDSPPIISLRGAFKLNTRPMIGIVGARNASLASRQFARDIACSLGNAGFSVVSGFARGIDTAAHIGALDTGTVGVLAGGVDHIYPPENAKLYGAMIEKGVFLAESPLGQRPQARHFPKRNRLISGLAYGLIVIEAAKQSGSLITARLGADQGREIFAVPGAPQDPRCTGSNDLLKNGATMVTSPEDILACLQRIGASPENTVIPAPLCETLITPMRTREQTEISDLTAKYRDTAQYTDKSLQKSSQSHHDTYNDILAALSFTPTPLDALLRACKVSAQILQIYLLELEIGGQIERLPGGKVCLRNKG